MRPILALLLIMTSLISHAAAPRVVASIKPLHSLAAMLMQGVGDPKLLLSGAIDPHHFSLLPSQRRLLNRADLIVWVGPQLESALAKAVAARPQQLALLDSPLPVKLPARGQGGRHGHHHGIDPHIWLSPANARSIVKQIARRLIALDGDHREQYQHNLQQALQQIDTLEDSIKQMADWSALRYIAWHDSYQYFEQYFGLQLAGAARSSDNQRTTARRLSALHDQLHKGETRCVVYDTLPMPALLANMPQAGLAFVYIDVLGNPLAAGASLWPDLMRQMAQDFLQCLSFDTSP